MSKSFQYQKALATYFTSDPEDVFLYWKGRVGLYAILKAMGIQKNDEVILPAFTCVVVPNALIYLGAQPVYVDIQEESFLPNLAQIKEKITSKTKCILVQNTFGLSYQVDEICAFAKENNIYTIEDCTHGFGGTFKGKANGTYSDAAFYSSQWNKPFSTGVGGFVYVKNPKIKSKLIKINEALIPVGTKQSISLKVLILMNRYLMNDLSYWPLLNLYRFLSKKGIVIGSSSGKEITTIEMPSDFFMASSKVQSHYGLKALSDFPQLLALRKKNALKLNAWMQKNGKYHIAPHLMKDHSFLKFPIICKNRELFMEKAHQAKVQLGDWFNSLLHPVQGDLSPWGIVHPNDFPKAKYYSESILNLPTQLKNTDKLLDFLEKNKELLE